MWPIAGDPHRSCCTGRDPVIRGLGLDTVAIERIERLLNRTGERFIRRVFTEAEADYCRERARPAESFAARFAAKEAVMKCLGSGWADGVGFLQIEVIRGLSGAPGIRLHGHAAVLAKRQGMEQFHLSLTHSGQDAVAVAVAESSA